MLTNQLIAFVFTCTWLLSLECTAQLTTFEKTLGKDRNDWANCISATRDGNYVVGGHIDSYSSGLNEFYLVKLNPDGDTLWTRIYESVSASSSVLDMEELSDSGFILVGNSLFPSDIFLLRTDASGNLLWQKSYGGSGTDYPYAVRATMDGGYIIAGSTNSYGGAGYNMYLIKTNAIGDTLWTRVWSTDSLDVARNVLETPDSGFLVTGTTWGYGAGEGDAVLIKTNKAGGITWVKTLGGAWDEDMYSLEKTKDGGYIMAGNTESWLGGVVTPIDSHPNYNKQDIYVIRLNANYDTVWTRTYGSGTLPPIDSAAYETAYAIKENGQGDFFIAGRRTKGLYVKEGYFLKIKASGDTVWTRNAGGGDIESLNGLEVAADNTALLVGYTRSFGAGKYDWYLLKTDVNGHTSCNTTPFNTQVGHTLTTIDTLNQFQVTSGCIVSNPSLLPVDSMGFINELCKCLVTVTISGKDTICQGDTLILTASSSGTKFQWSTGDTTASISVVPAASTTYSVIASNDTCGTEASRNVWVNNCASIRENLVIPQVTISPNPFSEKVIINMEDLIFNREKERQFALYDVLGREVLSSVLQTPNSELKRNGLPAGIYFYTIRSGHRTLANGKLVIQ